MILIALGANLPGPRGETPRETLWAARDAVAALPDLHLACCSNLYATAPQPPSGQPPYLNAMLGMTGTADPAALLGALHAIEARFGRSRGEVNAPRTLDLDIVAMGDLVRDAPDPILPHPRAHLRAFVLRPLADILPDWRHPVLGRSVGALLATVADQPIRQVAWESEEDGG